MSDTKSNRERLSEFAAANNLTVAFSDLIPDQDGGSVTLQVSGGFLPDDKMASCAGSAAKNRDIAVMEEQAQEMAAGKMLAILAIAKANPADPRLSFKRKLPTAPVKKADPVFDLAELARSYRIDIKYGEPVFDGSYGATVALTVSGQVLPGGKIEGSGDGEPDKDSGVTAKRAKAAAAIKMLRTLQDVVKGLDDLPPEKNPLFLGKDNHVKPYVPPIPGAAQKMRAVFSDFALLRFNDAWELISCLKRHGITAERKDVKEPRKPDTPLEYRCTLTLTCDKFDTPIIVSSEPRPTKNAALENSMLALFSSDDHLDKLIKVTSPSIAQGRK